MPRTTYELRRHRLADGAETTTYAVAHPLRGLCARVQLFRQPRRLTTGAPSTGS